ncbi:MAG: bifunctional riboflavin kinase/FAD synthetase [Chloroflexi bacterium]|nr:bifunctional riboflavin kinase/FAD synthetase [Chloroflexota bacterium]
MWLGDQIPSGPPFAATIGNFDGVHRGHQFVAREVVASARRSRWRAMAITFWPHPRTVLPGQRFLGYLTTIEERLALLESCGFDVALVVPFTLDFARQDPTEFVTSLVRSVPLRELWVGQDFRFGRQRSGDVALLEKLGNRLGFTAVVVPRIGENGSDVSSNALRRLLREGQVDAATTLMGRPYRLGGVVVHGDQRGRILGYPTANLAPDPAKIIPARGIYAAVAWVREGAFTAAVSVGIRPQFEGADERVEAYLLDFSGDLYGYRSTLDFAARLRDEVRFESVDALLQQMARDVEATRAVIAPALESFRASHPERHRNKPATSPGLSPGCH